MRTVGAGAALLVATLVVAPASDARSLAPLHEVRCEVQSVVGGAVAPGEADLSGDGRWLVYTSTQNVGGGNPDGGREVFRYDRETASTTQVSSFGSGDAWGPLVSDDGDRVLFSQLDAGQETLWSADITGATSDAELGPVAEEAIGGFDLSADGATATVASTEDLGGANPDESSEVWLLDVDGDVVTPVTAGEDTTSSEPTIDGDGSTVAFASTADLDPAGDNAEGAAEIFTWDGAFQQVTDIGTAVSGSSTPMIDDLGEHLAFESVAPPLGGAGQAVAYVDLADEAGPVAVEAPPKDEVYELDAISGDGRWVYTGASRWFAPTGSLQGLLDHLDGGLVGDVDGLTVAGLTDQALAVADCLTFLDVGFTHVFVDDVEWMALEGITTGSADGTFRPSLAVSRAAMAAFLYRFRGSPAFEAPEEPTFPDVGEDHPFFDEIEWMADEAITSGFGDGTYRPIGSVTRQSMAAFIYRTVGMPPFEAPEEPTFPDVGEDHPFFGEIEWMADEAITTGFGDGTYRPADEVTRQAMAAFLHRADRLLL